MKLAFTCCMSAYTFDDQPVWDQIDASGATQLVLLGDSAYYDVDESTIYAVKQMSAHEFAQHAYARLRHQCRQPQFRRLVMKPSLTTHAIWDDHDFLMNDACGLAVAADPTLAPLLPASRAAFDAYRNALTQRKPFPEPPDIWAADVPPPRYEPVALGDDVWLHLTDGRSYKSAGGKASLLGRAQFDKLEADIRSRTQAAPNAVHLLASGVTFHHPLGESWSDCVAERDRLLDLATDHRILMLSGDVHENRVPLPHRKPGALATHWPLLEVTSSGAALRRLVNYLKRVRNWGLLDIGPKTIGVRLTGLEGTTEVAIDRASWTLM